MQKAFSERYFPTSKKLKLKEWINNFQQTQGESISAAWEWFIEYLKSVPDHKIMTDSLLEICYRALDDNSKAVAEGL